MSNYLEELAGMQPQTPASPLGITDEPPGELVQPQSTQPPSESPSPELQAYIQQCVIDTVAQVMTTTVIPDVVESTLAKVRAEGVSTAMETPPPLSPPGAHPMVHPVGNPGAAGYYETPVPTLHMTGSQSHKQYMLANVVCWGAVTAIVAIMGGLAFFSIRQNPQTQTVQQNQQLNQSNQALTERLVESNQQVLDSRQRCGNFSLICNIKE